VNMDTPSTVTNPRNNLDYRDARGPSAANPATLWAEARFAYPLYTVLAVELGLTPLPYPHDELPPTRPTRSVFERDLKWLDAVDEHLLAYQLRQIPPEALHASEATLRAFIQRQLRKANKTTADRDKVDWLLAQYFALCAPEELYRQEIKFGDVANVLKPVLATTNAAPPEWCASLETILENLENCHSLRDIMENGLLEQGRLLKDTAGSRFYDPAALVAFCRVNFLLRRAFIRLLHADLESMQSAIRSLEAMCIKTVDCRRAGFSAAETTIQLRNFCANWRQPFQRDYTDNSVTRAFEQLLGLRTDIEEALANACLIRDNRDNDNGDESDFSPMDFMKESAAAAGGFTAAKVELPPNRDTARLDDSPVENPVPPGTDRPEQTIKTLPPGAAEADKCFDSIIKQLTVAHNSGNRSMATVLLHDTKVLLSSWEVTAFMNDSGQDSEDVCRAVVARALLAVAMDQRRRSGEKRALSSAIAHARNEVAYFRSQIEYAKQANSTEVAVNLGISTKRLLSSLDEAEQLQP